MLFERWIAGDQAAQAKLFGLHHARLLRFFERRSPQAADDLAQQTLLACMRGRPRMTAQTRFSAYLMTTARRMLWHERAARAKTTYRDVDAVSDIVCDVDPSDSQRLRRALGRLPTAHREILEGYYVEGRTGPELSAALALTEPAVRSRLRRALTALRREFERPPASRVTAR